MLPRLSESGVPEIRMPLPGPRAKALIEADHAVTSPSYTRMYPLAVQRAEGVMIEDLDGNRFLDFTAGIAVCATGHCHERVVAAIERQARRLIHMSGTDFYYEPQMELARKLAAMAPGPSPKRVFFTNSGAESVEAAFKLARFHTQRRQMIAFFGAFHGRTLGALSLTGSKVAQRRGFEPLIPEVHHVGFGDCYRCPYNLRYPECGLECVDYIERHLFRTTVPPEEVAAFIVEPIQGEGGYVVPPPDYHPRLKALAEKYGILYIADEVQTGMGRTGTMFASQHWQVEPDMVCLAKGLASGMPLGAMIARDAIMTWPRGAHASTFGGNPVSCAAALETIALLEEGLTENAARVGAYLKEKLEGLAARHNAIGQVRGLGLMLAIDLVRDRASREPAVELRDALIQTCFHQGLLLLGCGQSAIRFCPPLVVEPRHCDTAVKILDAALAAAGR